MTWLPSVVQHVCSRAACRTSCAARGWSQLLAGAAAGCNAQQILYTLTNWTVVIFLHNLGWSAGLAVHWAVRHVRDLVHGRHHELPGICTMQAPCGHLPLVGPDPTQPGSTSRPVDRHDL